jgi:hypothetical protein
MSDMGTSQSLIGGRLIDSPRIYHSYALYLTKFIEAYRSQGVKVDAITVQNEPQNRNPAGYPGTDMPASQEEKVIEALGPMLREAALRTAILGYDHNRSEHPNDIASTPPMRGRTSTTIRRRSCRLPRLAGSRGAAPAPAAHNENDNPQTFAVLEGSRSFTYTLPGGALATFTWNGNPGGRETLKQLDPSGWHATANPSGPTDPCCQGDVASNAVDDDASTRYSTGTGQQPGQYLHQLEWQLVERRRRARFRRPGRPPVDQRSS